MAVTNGAIAADGSIVRIAAASNRIITADPRACANQIIGMINNLKSVQPDIILFPKHCLTGGQCGNLLKNRMIIERIEDAIDDILDATKRLECYILIGGTLHKNGRPSDVTYLLYRGEVEAILADDTLFTVGNATIGVYAHPLSHLMLDAGGLASIGADIWLIPSYTASIAGSLEEDIARIRHISGATATSLVVANGGAGDTSYPNISTAYTGIFECGEQRAFDCALERESACIYDIDVDIIRAEKAKAELPVYAGETVCGIKSNTRAFLMRDLSDMPYLPEHPLRRQAYLEDLFKLQVSSLIRRMNNIHCERLVIGVSGGLDSTLALLVCAHATDSLKLPRSAIHAITMQGMGTTDRTYDNACMLMNSLGCTVSEIPIKAAVTQHLSDISHDGRHDVAYENAQARERTQILFDVANMENGIVVGTGDLSEAALGFCTFGGDHLASFNVNICLTKSMIRALVAQLADVLFIGESSVLHAILDTPVSPELLPPDADGEITQCTEVILGEYELHDFFLYYFVKYSFTPQKLLYYACKAFPEKYSGDYIADRLRIFLRRFATSQFKRSCSVDSSRITDISLNGFTMPSDIPNADILAGSI